MFKPEIEVEVVDGGQVVQSEIQVYKCSSLEYKPLSIVHDVINIRL
jgi:hypothetical protein